MKKSPPGVKAGQRLAGVDAAAEAPGGGCTAVLHTGFPSDMQRHAVVAVWAGRQIDPRVDSVRLHPGR